MAEASGPDLVVRIRVALSAGADPSRAPAQQAYMKSDMPFLGVGVPEVRRITRAWSEGEKDAVVLRNAARTLWDEATHREHRYAGMQLLALPPNRGSARLVPLIEYMVRTGRWWDITDELAHRVAELLDARPGETGIRMRSWSTDDDLWMRRLAIIGQLGRRDRVDVGLLAEVIRPNLDDPEFFIRKGIGWALRDCARTHPGWVRAFAATHLLSPLSRREALKHL